ncbi:MAG: hypothetical protein GY906_20055 [bacterium]|nr:hypothetical protein [bacterium]
MTPGTHHDFELSPDRYREQLQRAAISTRDLLHHRASGRWEVFAKASCARQQIFAPDDADLVSQTEETGVAVRSFSNDRHGFAAASDLGSNASRRAADGVRSSEVAIDFDPLPPQHLLGDSPLSQRSELAPAGWAAHFCQTLRSEIHTCSGGRVIPHRIAFQEGAFGWILTTSDDHTTHHETVSTSLLVEVRLRDRDAGIWRESVHLPRPSDSDPRKIALKVVDRVMLSNANNFEMAGIKDVICHGEVVAHIIAELIPLLTATPGDFDDLSTLVDQHGLLMSCDLSLVDDRTVEDGPLSSPSDGEGLSARRVLLVEEGVPRHRIASYRDAMVCHEQPRGGALRLSYRDYPASGASNVVVSSPEAISPSELLGNIDCAAYLLRPIAPVKLDPKRDSFRLLASGIWIEGGKVAGWQPAIEVSGGIGQLLRRIDGVGTDHGWHQTRAGFIDSPSLLLRRQTIGA